MRHLQDVGQNSPPVNLVGTLLPSSVSVTGSQSYTFGGSGSLGGMMSLVKSGSGQLAVTTSNTYSGGTIVSNGMLLINGSLGTGAVTVAGGGVLGGTGIIGGPVTVNGTLAPGNSPGTLTINNDLTVGGGAALQYDLGTNSDLTAVSGNLTLGGTLNLTMPVDSPTRHTPVHLRWCVDLQRTDSRHNTQHELHLYDLH